MQSTRWVKGNEFIELETALSVDKGTVVVVSSSRELPTLPVEFREQVPLKDDQAVNALRAAVERWAEKNQFTSTREA